MRNRTFIIGDTHFFHNRMVECKRPEDFTERTIQNWKKIVKENDTVIHLGDVIFYRNGEQTKELLDSLPGKKILCKGNHDSESDQWYMNHGFQFSCDIFLQDRILFSHRPINSLLQSYNSIDVNVHAHVHINCKYIAKAIDSFYRIFSLEIENYKPVELQSFLHKTKIGLNYYFPKMEKFL